MENSSYRTNITMLETKKIWFPHECENHIVDKYGKITLIQ